LARAQVGVSTNCVGKKGKLPNSTPDLVRVAVVGGSLAGLATTYELIRRARIDFLPLEIRLYEAEHRLGGAIRSEWKQGFLLEHGAASFSTSDVDVLRLVAELGLQNELIAAHAERGMLVWWNDACHLMPPGLSPLAIAGKRALLRNSLLSATGKLRVACERFVPTRRRRSEETAAAFVSRRFGRQMLERVGDPLVAQRHAGDPAKLCAHEALSELVELERRHGSVRRGLQLLAQQEPESETAFGIPKKITRSPVVSCREGMQTVVDAMAAAVRRSDTGALQLSRRVVGLRPAGDPVGAAAYALRTSDGEEWVADICVLALPGRESARLVGGFAPEVAEGLDGVPHASSLAVYLGFERSATQVPEAVGCLVPYSQGRPSLGCTFVHQEFDYRAPPGAALLRFDMGGTRNASLVDWEDPTAVRTARAEAKALFGIDDEPVFTRVVRRPRAHPQYVIGHGKRIKKIERELAFHSGLMIVGSCLYGTGVAARIANGRTTAITVADVARTRLA
jgi:oxygen-dependent protoporphyrinogen oxidase